MIDSLRGAEGGCKSVACAINALEKVNVQNIGGVTANTESSNEQRSMQSGSAYSDLAEAFPPNSNHLTLLMTANQSLLVSPRECLRDKFSRIRGAVSRSTLRVGS